MSTTTISDPRLSRIETHHSIIPPPQRGAPDWNERWSAFFQIYHGAMVRYVAACLPPWFSASNRLSEAKDVVSEFVETCMRRDSLCRFEGRGQFRAFLKTLLRRADVSRLRRETAQRRRPKGGLLDIDDEVGVASDDPAAAERLDRRFRLAVLTTASRRAHARMRDDPKLANGRLYAGVIRKLLSEGGLGSSLDGDGGDGGDGGEGGCDATARQRCEARKQFKTYLEREIRVLPVCDEDRRDLLELIQRD